MRLAHLLLLFLVPAMPACATAQGRYAGLGFPFRRKWSVSRSSSLDT